jgi:D-alanyl-lipoteichoic acid acyltransferase DltB (MBOAT superfamily)
LLGASLAGNLGLLGFFKYFNFFAESFAALAASIGWHAEPATLRVILPVGLSFYTFQELGYTIDVYRRRIPPATSLLEFMAFVAFFPQLVAGPIERASHMLPQYHAARTFSYPLAVDGCRRILWGFFKKLVIADNLGGYVQMMYPDPQAASGVELAAATFYFALQIYCDFSAYSDIALGSARLLGFKLMQNFASPYFSQTVGEFWRRWHISLSTWFRDYVYIPLGGSRVGPVRRALNLLATFCISGLWHGASWNFVIWGAVHGAAVIPSALSGRGSRLSAADVPGGTHWVPNPRTIVRVVRTFLIVTLAWVFFRARTLADASLILRKIFTDLCQLSTYAHLGDYNLGKHISIMAALFLLVEWVFRASPHPFCLDRFPRIVRWAAYTATLWATFYFAAGKTGPFIYFQF